VNNGQSETIGHPQSMLDSASMSWNQIRAVAITSAIAALDGYDVLAATFAAPGIARNLGLDQAALGTFLSSGLIGMAVGSLLLAPLADRFGRRPMVIFNLALMGLGMMMTAFAQSLTLLIFWRLITGIGIGSMVPIVAPLAAEYANARRRTLALAAMTIGYPVGGMVGGFGAAVLLTHFDWPAVFFLGTALSVLLFPLVLLWMPEPLPFLLKRDDAEALGRVNALLARFGQPAVSRLPKPPLASGTTYRQIFAPEQRVWTLRAAAAYPLFMFTLYYIMSWMPQIVVNAGYSPSAATMVSTIAAMAGAIASIILGFCGPSISRVGMGIIISGLGVAAVLFVILPPSLSLYMLAGGLVGICLYGGSVGIYAFIVNAFPVAMRATGIGFSMALARGAGAVSPALAGMLIAGGGKQAVVAAMIGSAAVISGIIVAASPARSSR
jgi:AAHS family 4-hydroxybenzoate transporter-like MFS transporter